MKKKVAILQSNYIPWRGYFDLINMVNEFIIYDIVQYTKGDWRNRNKIKTKNGIQWLTIPITHKSINQRVEETEVANISWGKKHWNTIQTNYGRAKFFKEYSNLFQELYNQKEKYLTKINLEFIKAINEILGIKTKISHCTDYKIIEGKNERLVALCIQAGASIYLSGPAAKNYIDENLFSEANIELQWMDYSGYPVYNQQYPPFIHEVTILDLIFNEGPNSINYLKSF